MVAVRMVVNVWLLCVWLWNVFLLCVWVWRIVTSLGMTDHRTKEATHPRPIKSREEATRTPDPHVPNVVRYQLRYFSRDALGFMQKSCRFVHYVHVFLCGRMVVNDFCVDVWLLCVHRGRGARVPSGMVWSIEPYGSDDTGA